MASAEDIILKIPGVGALASIFGAQSDEEKALLGQYKKMSQAYAAQRPITQQAHMNALNNVMNPGMLGPIQDQLAHMYGANARFNVNPLLNDPLAGAQKLHADMQAQYGAPPPTAPAAAPAPAYKAADSTVGGSSAQWRGDRYQQPAPSPAEKLAYDRRRR